jgi:hypothetical protein
MVGEVAIADAHGTFGRIDRDDCYGYTDSVVWAVAAMANGPVAWLVEDVAAGVDDSTPCETEPVAWPEEEQEIADAN